MSLPVYLTPCNFLKSNIIPTGYLKKINRGCNYLFINMCLNFLVTPKTVIVDNPIYKDFLSELEKH